MPSRGFADTLAPVRRGVEELAAIGATTCHDLCERMFQTLIADRKFLATFYTLPPSACLLAELAVQRLSVDWSDAEAESCERWQHIATELDWLAPAVNEGL